MRRRSIMRRMEKLLSFLGNLCYNGNHREVAQWVEQQKRASCLWSEQQSILACRRFEPSPPGDGDVAELVDAEVIGCGHVRDPNSNILGDF